VARAVICDPARRAAHEPLYDIHPRTGAIIEVFYAERVLARSSGACGPGWFWWTTQRGCLPHGLPTGPFGTSYRAYRDAALSTKILNAVGLTSRCGFDLHCDCGHSADTSSSQNP
jgi:hypothetical protein